MTQVIIPLQCAATTRKGVRCQNKAVAGTGTCRVHTARQSPKEAGVARAKQAFVEAVSRVTLQTAVEEIVNLWRSGALKDRPFFTQRPNPVILEHLANWYVSLSDASQRYIDDALALHLDQKISFNPKLTARDPVPPTP
jgi:hypothetical protein